MYKMVPEFIVTKCFPSFLQFYRKKYPSGILLTGTGKIDFIEFVNLMEKMTKPHEQNASTMEAFRVFDGEGSGVIDSRIMRDVIFKSLDQVSLREVQDMLDYSGLLQDRAITYDGRLKFYASVWICVHANLNSI